MEPFDAVDRDRFTILNGQKRIWASHVFGFEAIKARCLYVDDLQAAQIFASRHLDDDPEESDHTEASRAAAIRALRDEWGEQTHRIPGVPKGEKN